VKIRGEVGEISIPIVEAYLRPNLRNTVHLMAIHCAAADHGGLIKKKKIKNKESSWVKLKAFPTNIGRPN